MEGKDRNQFVQWRQRLVNPTPGPGSRSNDVRVADSANWGGVWASLAGGTPYV